MVITRLTMPFHTETIRKPQDAFNMVVDNNNLPFIHPLENYSVLDFVDADVEDVVAVKPLPIETTPFKLVETERIEGAGC
ncbi:hypothetical protein VNO77_14913 [Canavalia gladiata]|uniref:Uncharacterized protein n=1 Tax=Canavalia gladiata TaxID=3824 RepID=A0AAN9QR57_CANGL